VFIVNETTRDNANECVRYTHFKHNSKYEQYQRIRSNKNESNIMNALNDTVLDIHSYNYILFYFFCFS